MVIRRIVGSIFTLFGLFMAISTFQVAKDFVFQNYFRMDAAVAIRIVFVGVMFGITAYLIKTGIAIFGIMEKDGETKQIKTPKHTKKEAVDI